MKTNLLWQCLYCEKTLSTKRNVLMHISTIHKVDGNNPVKFRRMLVSPKNVTNILKGQTALINSEGEIASPAEITVSAAIATPAEISDPGEINGPGEIACPLSKIELAINGKIF